MSRRAWSLAAAVAALGLACLPGSADRPLGSACRSDGECRAGLVCQYGRCRTACELDRDCPPDSSCVPSGGDPAVRVCLPRPEDGCTDCPEGFGCDDEGLCRESCETRDDCAAGRDCVGNLCLELPAPDGDADADLDADGDAGADGGEPPLLGWGPPSPLEGTADLASCETDPVLTADSRWLLLSRPLSGADCYVSRRFHLFDMSGGSPLEVGPLPPFDPLAGEESNPHPVEGAFFGRPGSILFVHSVLTAADDEELRWVWLEGSPPAHAGGPPVAIDSINSAGYAFSPSLTLAGDRIVYARSLGDGFDEEIFEAVGSPLSGFGPERRLEEIGSPARETDPALSPDGLVIVFVRRLDSADDFDLWVARRASPELPFDPPELLPKGEGEINTEFDEMDAFVTAEGDLLYVSARAGDGARRVYRAPRLR